MLKKSTLLVATFFFVSFAARSVPAIAQSSTELGLTPSHVVSLWTNINDALVVIARITTRSKDVVSRLKGTVPQNFTGKKPADVLKRVAEFRDKLDRMRMERGMAPSRRYRHGSGTITPSVVFLNSGHVLDGAVSLIVKTTDRSQLVSQFYTRHNLAGKTPSHAFAMADLANRRIDIIQANQVN